MARIGSASIISQSNMAEDEGKRVEREGEERREGRKDRILELLALAKDYEDIKIKYPIARKAEVTSLQVVGIIQKMSFILMTETKTDPESGAVQIHAEAIIEALSAVYAENMTIIHSIFTELPDHILAVFNTKSDIESYKDDFGVQLIERLSNTVAALFSASTGVADPKEQQESLMLLLSTITILSSLTFAACDTHVVDDDTFFAYVEDYLLFQLSSNSELGIEIEEETIDIPGGSKLMDLFNDGDVTVSFVTDEHRVWIKHGSISKPFNLSTNITATFLTVFKYLQRQEFKSVKIVTDTATQKLLEGLSLKFIDDDELLDKYSKGLLPVFVPTDVSTMDEFLDIL